MGGNVSPPNSVIRLVPSWRGPKANCGIVALFGAVATYAGGLAAASRTGSTTTGR